MPRISVKMFKLKQKARRSVDGETAAPTLRAARVLRPVVNVGLSRVGTQQMLTIDLCNENAKGSTVG